MWLMARPCVLSPTRPRQSPSPRVVGSGLGRLGGVGCLKGTKELLGRGGHEDGRGRPLLVGTEEGIGHAWKETGLSDGTGLSVPPAQISPEAPVSWAALSPYTCARRDRAGLPLAWPVPTADTTAYTACQPQLTPRQGAQPKASPGL